MAETQDLKSERVTLALTALEARALEFVARIHPGRYEGTSSVLRDYSVTQAVEAYQLALAAVEVESAA